MFMEVNVFATKYNFDKFRRKPEVISCVDNVDRTGYIPLDLQFERLMSAGASLERVYTEQYMFEYQEVVDSLDANGLHDLLRDVSLRGNKYTPQALHDMYMDKYNKQKVHEANISKLQNNYKKWLKEKSEINNKLNEYKEFQENLNSTLNENNVTQMNNKS